MAGLDKLLNKINSSGTGPSEDSEATISRAQGEVQTRSQNANSDISKQLQTLKGGGDGGSALSAFGAAYKGTTGPVQELTDYIVSEVPELGTRLTTSGIQTAEDQYGEGFSAAEPQQRRDMIIQARAQAVEDEYGFTGDHPVAEFAGQMAGELMDPTSLAVWGRGVVGAIKTGGLVGGIGGATEGMATEGDIDLEDVAIGAAVGAATGGIIEAGVVQPVKKLVAKYKSRGKAPSSEELKADLEGSLTPEERDRFDFKKFNEELNNHITYGSGDPEINMALKKFKASDLSGRETDLGVEYAEASDYEFKSAMYDKWKEAPDSVEFNLPNYSKLKAESDYSDLGTKPKKREPFVAKHSVESELIDNAKNGYKPKKKGGKAEFYQEPKGFPTKTRETRMLRDGIETQYLNRKLAEDNAEKAAALKFFDGFVKSDSYTWQKIKQESLNVQGSKMAYQSSSEPGSLMYDIIANGHVPWTSDIGMKIRPPIGQAAKDDPFPEESWLTTSGSISRMIDGALSVISPERKLSGMKDTIGKVASKYLKDAHVNTNWKIGDSVSTYRINRLKAGIKAGSPEEEMARNVLNRTLDINKVPKSVRTFAEGVQKQLNDKYKEAYELGIVTKKEYDDAVKRGIEKGYLPRVTDMDKLRTKAGREEFIKRLSSKIMDLESAQKIVSAIARDEKGAERLMREINKQGDKAFINTTLARKLWEDYNVVSPTYRSKHLEAPRKLPEEWEDVMAPFQVENLEAVMASWAQDVNTRIEYTKVFGAKDENALKIIDRLNEVDSSKAELFYELYHTSVGSALSSTVKSFIDKPLKTRQLVAQAKAFQTMKLALAAIPNLTQGPLNGMYYVMSKSEVPTPKALNMWAKAGMKAVRASFGDAEARYTYDKFGAATQTMLLDAMGGMNESMHTVSGRKFTNTFVEFFNNPSVMLRKVGYFNVEEFSRRYGQFLGEAMVEDTLERKARFMAMGNRVNPKLLKRVDDTLIELGLDPTADPTKLSVNDVGLAGQRVANILNFTNDPQTAPLIMQSFWGKFATQFKTYIIKQTDFVAKKVIEPAVKGLNEAGRGAVRLKGGEVVEGLRGLRPLMAVMGVGTPTGMAVDSFRRWILGDDKDLSMTERVLRAHLLVGSMGALADIATQSVRTPQGFASWLAGPTVSDAGKVLFAAGQSAQQGSAKPLAKAAASTLVYPWRQNLVDSLTEEKSNFDNAFDMKFGDDSESFDPFK